jgi:hypothetical protein
VFKLLTEKRKEAAAKVKELKSLLVSIDWSGFNPQSPILTIRRVAEINQRLSELFGDKTLQQFLYDTEDIQKITLRLQPLAMISWISGTDLSDESRVVIQKLLSHQAYSNRALWPLAVANLIELNRHINNVPTSIIDADAAKWYRMFVVDHAVARMYPDKMAHPRGGDSGDFQNLVSTARDGLITTFERLIPQIMNQKQLNLKALQAFRLDDDPYLLRTAHYYGHRGNDYLINLQDLKWVNANADNPDNFRLVPELVEKSLLAYSHAIQLRLIAFAKSFRNFKSILHDDDIKSVESAIQWEEHWMRRNEAFLLTSQALADIANQYAAASCVHCYAYAHSLYEGTGNCEEFVGQAKSKLYKAAYYWKKANINGTHEGVGDPYRIMARKRLAEHMVHIASSGKWGLPDNHYEKKLESWEQDIFRQFYDMTRIAREKGAN